MSENRAGSRDWEPSFPEFAVPNPRGLYDDPSQGGAPYEPAPATSHVYGWRLKGGGFFTKFLLPAMIAQGIPVPPETKAMIEVAFKPDSNDNTIKSEYQYYFSSEGVADNYLGKFRGAEHPGHVVQELIRDRIPYHKFH